MSNINNKPTWPTSRQKDTVGIRFDDSFFDGPAKIIGEMLRKAREEQATSQRALANHVSQETGRRVRRAQIEGIEQGTFKTSPEVVFIMSRFLKLDLSGVMESSWLRHPETNLRPVEHDRRDNGGHQKPLKRRPHAGRRHLPQFA